MRSQYALFQSHLDLAHAFWRKLLLPGDRVLDATCGNGNDTLVLAHLVLLPDQGQVYAFDIQKKALQNTQALLQEHLQEKLLNRITFFEMCHSKMAEVIPQGSLKLIVYNLGYLPGSSKSITTLSDSTLTSIQAGLELLAPNGVISITCYPGHPEGAEEEKQLLEFCQTLDASRYNVSFHRFLNRNKAPSLIILQSV